MIEKMFAGLGVAVCMLLLLRLLVGARRRGRLDALARRLWRAASTHVRSVWHWRGARRRAREVADEAIRRARTGVERDGNVFEPHSFRGPKKPD